MPTLYSMLARRFGPKQDLISRREMLANTLRAGAGLLLSNTIAAGQIGRAGKRVIVVGAGFGGLSTAYELGSLGYDVTVIEARNRLGGRVLSFADVVPRKNVEGGGELIGSNHPTWVAYADKFKLKLIDVTEDEEAELPITLAGRRLKRAEARRLFEEIRASLSRFNALAANIDAYQPWKSDNAEALDRKPTAAWIDDLDASPLCKTGITAQLNADVGLSTAWQSLLANLAIIKGGGLERFWTDTEVLRCKGGNQQLAYKLANEIGMTRIQTGVPVRKITTRSGGVVVAILADGRTLEADDVVLATPPSVWKRIDIDPPLPAMLTPQMGSNVKFLVTLKRPVWKKGVLSAQSLSDGPLCMTWEGTDNQPRGGNVVLTAFSGGEAAEECRYWLASQRVAKCIAHMEVGHPGTRQNFVASRFMDWPGEMWTNAGYSFPAPGQVTTIGPILDEGLGHLHFAGEHACPAFVGFMEGALNSGAAVAKRIAKRDGLVQ